MEGNDVGAQRTESEDGEERVRLLQREGFGDGRRGGEGRGKAGTRTGDADARHDWGNAKQRCSEAPHK